MILLFWDIDGTLLTTGRAGIIAWEDACRAVTRQALDFQQLKTDGLTDHQVAMAIMEQARHASTDEDLRRLVSCYEERLPERLHERKGRVLEGVREALDHFRACRPEIHSMLLTGNTEAGARAKLTHYGLAEFFEGGAFSIDAGPRAAIASRALQTVRGNFPNENIEAQHVFVIGDTPHDIACAKAIGARAIAVATGVYSASDLRAYGAWRVFNRVPPPHEFTALVEDAV
jgi:phosphoglycolate phosphatase-like HAD superfamily hydrolase